MTARVLEGKPLAGLLQERIAAEVAALVSEHQVVPALAAVLVGDDPASQVYVRNKRRACQRAGIDSRLDTLPAETSTKALLAHIAELNQDARVHGILVQLPLPRGIDTQRVLDAVDPAKDVDCFHPENVGRLMQGRPRFLPCTPQGVLELLHHYGIEVQGRHVVVVGRSDIVGKPLAAMLVQRDGALGPAMANATVTICHSRTQQLDGLTREADIVVAAVGQPRLITGAMIRQGAVVVDVGINRTSDGLVGDVDFESAAERASAITPVPGGIGPLTIAMLLRNTLCAARLRVASG